MSSEDPNPYASPMSDPATDDNLGVETRKKVETIIREANQFWVAILLCVFCCGIGSIIITPWYGLRLVQWHFVARSHPDLLVRDAPPLSLAKNFQSAKVKLIIGMVAGIGLFAAGALYNVFVATVAS